MHRSSAGLTLYKGLSMKIRIIYMLVLMSLAVACDTAGVGEPVQYGEISVAIEGDPEVEAVTKAAFDLDPYSPEAAEYIVRIFNDSGVKQYEAKFSEAQSKILEFGKYYVTAENCTEAEAEAGIGKMRLAGSSAEVELNSENLSENVSVECTVQNAKVSVIFDVSALGRFKDDFKVVLTGGTTDGRSIEIRESAEVTETWFNPSTLNYTVSGTYSYGGIEKFVTASDMRILNEKDNIEINVKVESSNGQLVPEVSFDKELIESEQKPGFNPYKRIINN